jgi:hypothetical protein
MDGVGRSAYFTQLQRVSNENKDMKERKEVVCLSTY